MQAVILAGGLGTRLKSITGAVPKPLALIRGKPFLEYQLVALRNSAIVDLVFCLGYGAAEIQNYFGDGSRWGVTIQYALESELRGTAGALKNAGRFLDNSFFVLNGDTFADLDYKALARFHRAKAASATLAVQRLASPDPPGNVVLDADQAIIEFREKEVRQAAEWRNAGIYFLERTVLDAIPGDAHVSLEFETFPRLIASGARIYGFLFSNYFIDIGTPETYSRFALDLKEGRAHVVSK